MNKEQRIDELIEQSLVAMRERLRKDWERHRRIGIPEFVPISFAEVTPKGTWLYSADGAVLAYSLGPEGLLWAGHLPQIDSPLYRLVGHTPAPACDCPPCTVYRTCFTSEVAA